MKKIVLTTVLAFGTLGFMACSDDDDKGGKSCSELVLDISTLGQNYLEDSSDENCEAYRAALQAYLDQKCEDELHPDVVEMMLSDLPCAE